MANSRPVAVCSPKQAHCELGDRVLGGDRIVEHSYAPVLRDVHRNARRELAWGGSMTSVLSPGSRRCVRNSCVDVSCLTILGFSR